jgi:cell division protein FtsL
MSDIQYKIKGGSKMNRLKSLSGVFKVLLVVIVLAALFSNYMAIRELRKTAEIQTRINNNIESQIDIQYDIQIIQQSIINKLMEKK